MKRKLLRAALLSEKGQELLPLAADPFPDGETFGNTPPHEPLGDARSGPNSRRGCSPTPGLGTGPPRPARRSLGEPLNRHPALPPQPYLPRRSPQHAAAAPAEGKAGLKQRPREPRPAPSIPGHTARTSAPQTAGNGRDATDPAQRGSGRKLEHVPPTSPRLFRGDPRAGGGSAGRAGQTLSRVGGSSPPQRRPQPPWRIAGSESARLAGKGAQRGENKEVTRR